ncbi:MAG: hypothetical protein KTR29_08440 [Rhodothermaceae bacterium]|nr:hypothetical protein [Rhodothermaceae bacterium]
MNRKIIIIGLLLLILSAGCDSDVDPVLGTDQPFTLFGLFSPQLDTQRVLVFPIEPELQLLGNEALDARFTSTDLTNQDMRVWSDSILPQPNGEVNHMFWSSFTAEFDHTYLVEVEDSDGRRVEVSVRVPPETEIVLQDTDLISGIIVPVLIPGDVPNIFKVEVRYGFDYRLTTAGQKIDNLTISQEGRFQKTEEGWLIRINLRSDFVTIRDFIQDRLPVDRSYGFDLQGMLLRLVVASADWQPPGGVFDPDVLVQPGTLSNVENGFGFVGAGYRLQENLALPDSVKREAGFRIR